MSDHNKSNSVRIAFAGSSVGQIVASAMKKIAQVVSEDSLTSFKDRRLTRTPSLKDFHLQAISMNGGGQRAFTDKPNKKKGVDPHGFNKKQHQQKLG